MPLVDFADVNESTNILLYGEGGCGKTIAAAEFIGRNGVLIATENGVKSAKLMGIQGRAWPVKTWQDFIDAYAYCKSHSSTIKRIAIDSITEMQELARDMIIEREHKSNPRHSEWGMEWQENLEFQQITRMMTKRFCGLKADCVFTALPMMTEDADGNDWLVPAVEGKKGAISHYVSGKMDAVAYMRTAIVKKDEVYRTYWRRRTGHFYAKNRFGLPAMTEGKKLNEIIPTLQPARTRRVSSAKKEK